MFRRDFLNQTIDDLFKDLSLKEEVDLEDAKLLDLHSFRIGKSSYQQKVYRLKNNQIYVTTELIKYKELEGYENDLRKAIKEENFEEAAVLRDKIKAFLKEK